MASGEGTLGEKILSTEGIHLIQANQASAEEFAEAIGKSLEAAEESESNMLPNSCCNEETKTNCSEFDEEETAWSTQHTAGRSSTV